MSTQIPTPIPLGAPHLINPPIFDRTASPSRRRNGLDNRSYSRRDIEVDIWLYDPKTQSILRCRTDNVSDAGIHASAPIGYGLAVAQRFEARIANSAEPGLTGFDQLSKTLGYGTIVRTEMRLSGDREDRIGFAIRFDVPQLLPV